MELKQLQTHFEFNLIQDKILFGKESDIEFLHVSTLNIYKSLLEKYFKH